MKSKICVLMSMLLLLSGMVYTGCGDDEWDGNLDGTTWTGSGVFMEVAGIHAVSFTGTIFSYSSPDGGVDVGTYEQNGKNVALTLYGQMITGTISGDILLIGAVQLHRM